MLCCSLLFSSILFYFILFYFILFYVVLTCSYQFQFSLSRSFPLCYTWVCCILTYAIFLIALFVFMELINDYPFGPERAGGEGPGEPQPGRAAAPLAGH